MQSSTAIADIPGPEARTSTSTDIIDIVGLKHGRAPFSPIALDVSTLLLCIEDIPDVHPLDLYRIDGGRSIRFRKREEPCLSEWRYTSSRRGKSTTTSSSSSSSRPQLLLSYIYIGPMAVIGCSRTTSRQLYAALHTHTHTQTVRRRHTRSNNEACQTGKSAILIRI